MSGSPVAWHGGGSARSHRRFLAPLQHGAPQPGDLLWQPSTPRSLPGLAHAARAPRIRKGVSSVPAWLRRLHCLVRSNPEDRKGRGNLFEFRNRCILIHGHVGSRSRCALQVRPQNGGTVLCWNLFEMDLLTAAATEHRSSTGCTYVVDPVHVLSEH